MEFFQQFNSSNVKGEFSVPSGHCWPQDTGINMCGPYPWPFTKFPGNFWPAENCGYDGPGEMLKHFYGKDIIKKDKTVKSDSDNLIYFDQREFNHIPGVDPHYNGFSDEGAVYVPK